MYVITRADLPSNYQLPQTAHAVADIMVKFPQETIKWNKESNSIVVLETKNEKELFALGQTLAKKSFQFIKFCEPDIGDALTSIAIVPGQLNTKKVLSNLPLAGKKPQTANLQENLNKTFDLIDAMNSCEQFPGQTIFQHGQSVRDHLLDLVELIGNPGWTPEREWKYPEWVFKYSKQLLGCLLDKYTLEKYTIFHDAGKHLVKSVDEEGKIHYYGHAQKSAEIWATISDDILVKELISRDMEIHKLKTEEVPEFCRNKEVAISLLLAGLAEIHSNAKFTGGLQADSFKIKWKQIDKKGITICKFLFGN